MSERHTTRSQLNLWQALHNLAPVAVESAGRPLFRSGEPPQGIYLVEEGRVRLCISSQPRPEQVFEVAGAGSVLGLSESVSGEDYKLTAEAEAGARVSYIERGVLLHCLRNDKCLCMEIVRFLSEDLHSLYYQFRRIGHAKSAWVNDPTTTVN